MRVTWPAPPPRGRSDERWLDSGELAEHLPVRRAVAEVEHLVVRAAGAQPGVHAGADAAGGAEVAVGHLELRQLVGVEDLALGDDEPEPRAAKRQERGERGRARAVLEQERRRVVEPAD